MSKNELYGTQDAYDYLQLLERTVSDLESLIYELETQTTHRTDKKVPMDITFDAVPIVKKLNEARRQAQSSLDFFRSKSA